jgi:hypothetical protein
MYIYIHINIYIYIYLFIQEQSTKGDGGWKGGMGGGLRTAVAPRSSHHPLHDGPMLGPCWAQLGAVLGLWPMMGPSWAHDGSMFRPSWAHVGPMLGPWLAHLGPEAHNGPMSIQVYMYVYIYIHIYIYIYTCKPPHGCRNQSVNKITHLTMGPWIRFRNREFGFGILN